MGGQETSAGDHVTLRFRAAWMASHSVSATTPRKFFFLTTLTDPGSACAPSAARSLAPGVAGRITRPCNIPGTRTSTIYVKRPVALSGMSIRGTGWPTIVYWSGDFGRALPATSSEEPSPLVFNVTSECRAPIGSPKDVVYGA